jgi:hypothetical protein
MYPVNSARDGKIMEESKMPRIVRQQSEIDLDMGSLHASSIDEVIAALDNIIEWSKINNNRCGYFAALYRKVTQHVKQGIVDGYFDDGERMERLDVIFANRYLDAFRQYHSGVEVTDVWQLAFDTTGKWAPLVLHHLMLGMNAHINLDLGIAAAQTVSADEMQDLKSDFEKINEVLSSLVNEVEEDLGKIWPLFSWLDKIAGSLDERLADAGMTFARDKAWEFAMKYSASEMPQVLVTEMDKKMHTAGRLFMHQGVLQHLILFLVRIGETGNVRTKIEILEK